MPLTFVNISSLHPHYKTVTNNLKHEWLGISRY